MRIVRHAIETLNDLFSALFRPGEGEVPILRQPQRPLREDLFALFFPEALVVQYADKSKSNLTWFFNSDARNKSVRRSLVALLREDAPAVVADAHRKAHAALWPAPGKPDFDAAALAEALDAVRMPAGDYPVERFFAVDEAAALSRVILTLAVAGDAPGDVMAAIWREDGGDCGFLRRDDSFAGRLRYCRMLDLQGRGDRAFEGYLELAEQLGRAAETLDESTLYCRLGEMLFTGEGCPRDEKSAQAFDRLGCLDENPRSWYQLAMHTSGNPAREAMEHAAELGYGPAVCRLGMAWYNGSARMATPRSLDAARRAFQRGLSLPGADGAQCAYMLGQIYEAQGDRDGAVNAYRLAQESGSAEAAERLARLDWMLAPAEAEPPRLSLGQSPGYCLVNGLTGCNRVFLEGLRGQWEVSVCADAADGPLPEGAKLRAEPPEAVLRAMSRDVFWGGALAFPELTVALLSGDRERNLCQAVALLGELQRLAQSLGDRAWDLVDCVSIYVLAGHDDAGPLLDAAMAGLGQLYFRVRLCDPALDAADRLFAAAPLFLPRLSAPEDAPVRLKIVGCGDAAMAALRRAMALPLPEAAARGIDIYGVGAGDMQRRLRQLCPGLSGEAAALCGPVPEFHECDPERDLPEALERGLGEGDYYIVAAGDDALNLRLGMQLRGALLRRDPGLERHPFIAVHTRNPVVQWLAGSLPAGPEGGQGPSARWHSQFDLFPFGALDMYAARALAEDPLERRARQAHMLFIGLPDTRDARHAAMASYYKRQLGRDTARTAAQCLIYRMHMAGVSLPGWRLYGVPEEEARLGAAYTRWLAEEENLRSAVRDEHARRNRMLLALGWSPASLEQLRAYVGRGNPGHLLYPARLDPFICPWEALESGELLRQVREAVRTRFPEKSVPDPRRDEEASVRDTERMLDGGR